jgi:hypothetical protein
MFMIRGTAQPFKFILPHSLEALDWITVEFSQPNNPDESLPIIKNKTHCSERDGAIYVSLNANETKKFSDKYKAKVQLRAQPLGGVPFGNIPQLVTVYPMSDNIIDADTENDNPAPTQDEWTTLDGGAIGS